MRQLDFCQEKVYSVNMSKPKNSENRYHHGNLKDELIAVARRFIEETGHGGLSLRKCADAIGVSPTAPQNHFGNKSGLLTALAAEGYAELATSMRETLASDASRSERRKVALQGYVSFAKANPALYELMFSRNRIVDDDPVLLANIGDCFSILADISQELDLLTDTDHNAAAKAQMFVWSLVHGYAQLVTANRLKKSEMQGVDILSVFPEGKSPSPKS